MWLMTPEKNLLLSWAMIQKIEAAEDFLSIRFVCYPPYCFCNFPFPRMGCSLVGGKGKSCRREILCYGIKGWIRQPVDENRGSIISIRVLIFARSWTSWKDASATVLCQKTVQLVRPMRLIRSVRRSRKNECFRHFPKSQDEGSASIFLRSLQSIRFLRNSSSAGFKRTIFPITIL